MLYIIYIYIYIMFREYSMIKFFNHLICSKPIKNNVVRNKLTSLSHISWIFYRSKQYFSIKGASKRALSHIS